MPRGADQSTSTAAHDESETSRERLLRQPCSSLPKPILYLKGPVAAWGYVNESNQPWPLKRGNPRPRRKNAWYVLSTRCSTSCSTCEYTLPSAGSAALQAGNCADCMEKDTQVRHNFQASRRSLRASLYNWRHTSSVENKTSRCLRFGHSRYLYVLLIFDILLDDRQRRTPDGGHEIAIRSQRRQP